MIRLSLKPFRKSEMELKRKQEEEDRKKRDEEEKVIQVWTPPKIFVVYLMFCVRGAQILD